ncbi:hypothetical protein ABU178_10845 [Pantoea osteomyelitidis]|uniref:Uncharacterized protein n=1 Tax=Pantoea osteomyelitidis TaxID=3230026 RepID=A0ABW7PWH2_9GAMM
MLTEPEARRWASLMLIAALRGDLRPDIVAKHISTMRHRHGADVFEDVLKAMLLEAGRVGPGHCDGSLYRTVKSTTKPVVPA